MMSEQEWTDLVDQLLEEYSYKQVEEMVALIAGGHTVDNAIQTVISNHDRGVEHGKLQ